MPELDATSADEHDLNDLAALAENRLDPQARARVEAHLIACADCRRAFATFARASAVEAATRSATGSAWYRRPAPLLAMAATLAMATVVSVALFRSTEPPAGVIVAPAPTAAPPQPGTPAPAVQPAPVVPQGVQSGRNAQPDPGARRSGERRVGEKRFRLEAGTWVDAAFDPANLLPTTDVTSSDARDALLRDHPALKAYAALGPRVVVVFEGVVYRFDVP